MKLAKSFVVVCMLERERKTFQMRADLKLTKTLAKAASKYNNNNNNKEK